MKFILSASADNAITINMETQQMSNWCWAASIKACVRYYNPVTQATQTNIVTLVKGSAINEGATYAEIYQGLQWWGLSSGYQDGNLFLARVKTEVDAGRPTIALCTYGNSAHAVVSGAYQDSSSNKFIGYKDPAYGNVMQACNVGSSGGNAFYVVHNGITKYSYGAMIYIQP